MAEKQRQKLSQALDPGEQGSRDFVLAEAGGPGEVTPTQALPERIQKGITRRHDVTDRNLDFEGEMGYPTPT